MKEAKEILILDDISIKKVIRNLQMVLEGPFFNWNGNTFSKAKIKEHPRKFSKLYYSKRARPMILVKFGINTIVFYEKDRFEFDLDEVKVKTVKGEKIKFSKVNLPIWRSINVKKKEQILAETEMRINSFLEEQSIIDDKEEILSMVNEKFIF